MVISGTDWSPSSEAHPRSRCRTRRGSSEPRLSDLRRSLGSAWGGGLLGAAFAVLAVLVYALLK